MKQSLIAQRSFEIAAKGSQKTLIQDLKAGPYLFDISVSVKFAMGAGGKFDLIIRDSLQNEMYSLNKFELKSKTKKEIRYCSNFYVLDIQEPASLQVVFYNEKKLRSLVFQITVQQENTTEYGAELLHLSSIDEPNSPSNNNNNPNISPNSNLNINPIISANTLTKMGPQFPRLTLANRRFLSAVHSFSHFMGTATPKSLKDVSTLIQAPDYRASGQFAVDLADQFESGDVILFSGNCGISKGIRITTASTWSHVAMIVRDPSQKILTLYNITQNDPELKFARLANLYVFESDTEISTLGEKKSGVQLVPLETWLRNCQIEAGNDYLACWRKLVFDQPKSATMKQDLESVLVLYRDSIYDWRLKELIRSKFKKNDFSSVDENQIFCSELVALAYRGLGVLPDFIVPNNLVPRDFSSEFYRHRGFGRWEDKTDLPLIGAHLAKEVRVLLGGK